MVSASSTDSVIFQIFLEILHIPGGWHWGGRHANEMLVTVGLGARIRFEEEPEAVAPNP